MTRKRWSAKTEVTPALLKFREKRKWQIALRRYVLEKNICVLYAPYFGLDIENLRKWFEAQFEKGIGWGDFAKNWQFDHIIPVTYFDSSNEAELKLCWNFTNIRVEQFQRNKDRGNRLDVLAAKRYFEELYEMINSEKQQAFIIENRPYLDLIENYSAFEFELINSGRNISEVKKEIAFLKKFEN